MIEAPTDDLGRLRLPADRRAAERRRAAAAQGGHQRARRHHADARQLARHADADGDAGLLRRRRRVFYGVSLIVWILGLSRVPVSIAYPMLSLGYVVNAIAAHYLFGEAVTVHALARHRLHHRSASGWWRGADDGDAAPTRRSSSRARCIDEATIAGVADVLRSGQITSGPWVETFESDAVGVLRRPAGARRDVGHGGARDRAAARAASARATK